MENIYDNNFAEQHMLERSLVEITLPQKRKECLK
jgi:hypothetical protein